MKLRYVLIILAIMLASVLVLIYKESKIKNHATLVFLDVGQGDAILLVTPLGKSILIDGGQYGGLGSQVSQYLHPGDRTIDIMVASHPDLDHIGGLIDIAREFKVNKIIHSGSNSQDMPYQQLAKELMVLDTEVFEATSGQVYSLEPGIWIEVLSPYPGHQFDSKNDESIVMMLHIFNKKVLLTGDAGWETEAFLRRNYNDLEADILKLGHHGSKTSSSPSFLGSVSPDYAIASSGCANRFGHPHTEVVRRVEDLGINLLTTCFDGDVVFSIGSSGVILNN